MPHFDTWPWKLAIVLALLGMREFARLFAPRGAHGAASADDPGRWLVEMCDSAALAVGLVLFIIQPFLLQAFYIPSGSMLNTLQIQDRLLVSKLVYRLRDPRFQEVVVFRAPPDALRTSALEDGPGSETDFIKRCIGTPGDVVYALNRRYYRNGQLLQEPYALWSPQDADPLHHKYYSYDMKIVDGKVYSRDYDIPGVSSGWLYEGIRLPDAEARRVDRAPWTQSRVPPGMFLMLGDHRNDSNDGHVWGFVSRENVVGKAIGVFWPPSRIGVLDRMSGRPATPPTPAYAVP